MARKTETRREVPGKAPGREPLKEQLKAPPTSLGKARWMLELGDVRRARAFAEEAAAAGSEAEKAEARALLERLAPDRGIMLSAAAVLLLIMLAAWVAILHVH